MRRFLRDNSLGLVVLALFLLTLAGNAWSGFYADRAERLEHHQQPTSAEFWFESMQNWQSEFLAVLTIVVLSIWLRQKGSPESKPVNAPHAVTGEEVS